MAAKKGMNAILYRGTAGSTAATAMSNVRDLSLPNEKGEADISTRGSGFECVKGTQVKLSIEWQMLWDEDNADFAAILDAYLNQDAIALKSISASGGAGVDGDFVITKCSRNEALKDALLADIVAKPTYVTRHAAWV